METESNNPHEAVIAWANHTLTSLGYSLLHNQPNTVQETPWSFVARFETTQGNIYLKHTPELIALEPTITKTLRDRFHAPVPEVIAQNNELHCFVMKDAGKPLRSVLKQEFNTGLLCNAIEEFTTIQSTVADHVNMLLDLGVPDWRLHKLPELYRQLLQHSEFLTTHGLTEKDIHELKTLQPTVHKLCQKLLSFGMKQSLVQCDFHDNNVLIDDRNSTITFIDLGEIVISHPLFSLITCLQQTKRYHAITEADERYQQLIKTCLKSHGESKQHSLEAFNIAQKLWVVYEALAQYRLRLACDHAAFLPFQQHDKLARRLKEFIAVNNQELEKQHASATNIRMPVIAEE